MLGEQGTKERKGLDLRDTTRNTHTQTHTEAEHKIKLVAHPSTVTKGYQNAIYHK